MQIENSIKMIIIFTFLVQTNCDLKISKVFGFILEIRTGEFSSVAQWSLVTLDFIFEL